MLSDEEKQNVDFDNYVKNSVSIAINAYRCGQSFEDFLNNLKSVMIGKLLPIDEIKAIYNIIKAT